MKKKIIVVGVNHAGTSFIRTLKRLDPEIEINAYDKNTDICFLGCGIALWVSGEFEKPDGLFYASKQILEDEFDTKVKMQHEVVAIDENKKVVTVKNLLDGTTFEDSYDELVFAGGTWPIKIPVEGVDSENILFSKIFAHAQKIHKANRDPEIKDVVVLGAGYIGVELVEAFSEAGKNVTLVDMQERIIPNYFDKEFTDPMQDQMKKDGVHFAAGEKLVKFTEQDGKVKSVVTDKGEYKADLVIMSVGFKPNTDMLKGKVDMTPTGAIIVDNKQRSSNKSIYAIGDSCALHHNILGTAHVALATNAVKTGLVAAFNAADKKLDFLGVNGTNAIAVFGYKFSSTGISETAAKRFNIDHAVSFIKDKDRPEFMKTAEDVMFKIVYDPKTLKLLGAQIGSRENHTEVMYAMSLAISQGLTVTDLALMDVFFLPHLNKPFNFIIQAVLKAIDLKY